MSVVICHHKECIYNDDGHCEKSRIHIGAYGVCEDVDEDTEDDS